MMSNRWELVLKLLSAAIAIFGVVGYFIDKQQDRTNLRNINAFVLIEKYQSQPMLDVREGLLSFWGEHAEAIAYFQKNVPDPRGYRGFIINAVGSSNTPLKLYRFITQQVGFYDYLGVCVKYEVCDREIITERFCNSAKMVYASYNPIIEMRNKAAGASSLGSGLKELIIECE